MIRLCRQSCVEPDGDKTIQVGDISNQPEDIEFRG